MTYQIYSGVQRKKKYRPLLTVLGLIVMLGGGYLVINALSPELPMNLAADSAAVTKKLTQKQPTLKDDRLYVPKIGVDVEIVTGVTDKTLEGGAWHRAPENGDPAAGGNFVLAAHRFNLGLTPNQTRAKSPFYHIDALQQGDQIFVDFSGTRYAYEVTKRYKVADDDISIESSIVGSRLTMYSCDLRGPKAGREVIEAKPVGTIAWTSGGPKLKSVQ